MASIPLPLTDRIAQSSQMQSRERYLHLQYGDGYLQSSRDGINSREARWNVKWHGLSSEEAKFLRFLFMELGGSDTIEWQHPLADEPEQWMALEHTVEPDQNGGPYWTVTASLMKRNI